MYIVAEGSESKSADLFERESKDDERCVVPTVDAAPALPVQTSDGTTSMLMQLCMNSLQHWFAFLHKSSYWYLDTPAITIFLKQVSVFACRG